MSVDQRVFLLAAAVCLVLAVMTWLIVVIVGFTVGLAHFLMYFGL